MKKEQLIDLLVESGACSAEELKGKKIKELREMHANAIQTELQPMNSIDDTDPSWSDHVMSHFVDNELKDGMPTCDGLRRVFKKLIGEITDRYVDVLKCPTMTDPTATVLCTIRYKKRGSVKEFSTSDVFDVNNDNTPWPYSKASTATAATKAEARALRKGLGLVKVYSAEEVHEAIDVSDVSMASVDGNKPISDSAKIAINTMANRLGIKPSKLFKFMSLDKEDVSNLTYTEGHAVLAKLNSFTRGEANGGESIPEQIKSSEIVF